jgi:hypothetical protein
MPSVTASVQSAADDQRAACAVSGTWNFMDNAGLAIGDSASTAFDWVSIFRMQLFVPRGATINNATMLVRADGAYSVALTAKIYALASDDAVMPASAAAFTSAAKTTASVSWALTAWTAGDPFATPNVATVVQEVTDRAGWDAGNYIAMVIGDNAAGWGGVDNRRLISSYDTPALAAQLAVDYTDAAPIGVPIPTIQIP